MGGDATINADLARRVLAGEHGAHRDIVSLNAGAGLVVAGLADDLPAGIEAAREAIDSGAAVAALAALVEVSQREAAEGEAAQPPGGAARCARMGEARRPERRPITTVILLGDDR